MFVCVCRELGILDAVEWHEMQPILLCALLVRREVEKIDAIENMECVSRSGYV